MARLIDLASVLRSKNAGPLAVTFDIMFDTRDQLDHVLDAQALTPAVISALYGVAEQDVRIIPYAIVNALKITIPRRQVSGSILDDDIYGCQQHLPLAGVDIPDRSAQP